VFAGAVFFEVLMLEGVRRHLPRETMILVERAVADRARRLHAGVFGHLVPIIVLARTMFHLTW
jgi:hypothetical protein